MADDIKDMWFKGDGGENTQTTTATQTAEPPAQGSEPVGEAASTESGEEKAPETKPEQENKPNAEEVKQGESEVKSEVGEQPPEIPEYLKKFNEFSGSEFKTDDDLKTYFDNNKKISDEYEMLKSKADEVIDMEKYIEEWKLYDPATLAGGEENLKKIAVANELAKSGDRAVSQRLAFADLSKINDLDLMGWYALYKNPEIEGGHRGGIEAYLEAAGVNTEEIEDWSGAKDLFDKLPAKKRAVVQLKASELRDEITRKINAVEVPEVKNPVKSLIEKQELKKKETATLKGEWDKVMTPEYRESFKTLPLKDYGFDFEIKEDVSQIVSDVVNSAARRGINPDDAGRQKVARVIQEELFSRNRKKIIDAIVSQKEAEIRAELQKQYNNKTPLSTPQSPPSDEKSKEANAQWRRVIGV